MEEKICINGFRHYDKLPVGYRLATIDDFHFQGKKRIGMEYLIRRSSTDRCDVHTVTMDMDGKWLIKFIKVNRVFVKS